MVPEATRLCSELEELVGENMRIKINDNRSTILSVKWLPDQIRLSIHKFFLQAPQNILQQLAGYIRGEAGLSPDVKAFIETNTQELDYSDRVDRKKLVVQGTYFNLKEFYDQVNEKYFDNSLDLSITWFGRKRHKTRSICTLGLYYEPLKLIKIHKRLDREDLPDYVAAFIIYHEMLHAVYPPYVDAKGTTHAHGPLFQAKEKEFAEYTAAQKWLKEFQEDFFAG